MESLDTAIIELQRTLGENRTGRHWRWRVRQGLSGVREALADEQFRSWDGWLSARSQTNNRERTRLRARITAIGPAVLDRLDLDSAAAEVRRLLADVEHYRQRVHDLIYDDVALELGGSE